MKECEDMQKYKKLEILSRDLKYIKFYQAVNKLMTLLRICVTAAVCAKCIRDIALIAKK